MREVPMRYVKANQIGIVLFVVSGTATLQQCSGRIVSYAGTCLIWPWLAGSRLHFLVDAPPCCKCRIARLLRGLHRIFLV